MKKPNAKAITVLLISLSISLSSGCIFPEITSQAPPTTPPTSPSPIVPSWTPPGGAGGNPTLPDMVSVVERVKPSVVVIDVRARGYDIFNFPITQEGAGSGWILDANGLIVTNNHVVEGAEDIVVTLDDGRSFTALKVSTDPVSDLAVVKIDATGLPAAKVGDSSKLKVGMLVAAIGNALGRGISMTGGWISRMGVSIESSGGQTLNDLIETDAAINPGNSGGPLVNMAGEVIGITSAKLVDVNVEGVGYAIAINTAMPILRELVTKGYVTRPWFGISFLTVDQGTASRYGLSTEKGALITSVGSGSPASAAGLKPGDVIVGVNDKEIASAQELTQAIHNCIIGQKAKIGFWRKNRQMTADLTPVESPRS